MAFVDESSGKIVVRVVYDGPALAGKTTNVEKLCGHFRGRARSELESPEQTGERTRFLDWLQVDTGLVSGRQLSCHFITVPGQRVLTRRRKFLLELADAVVFVCSAEPEQSAENLGCFNSLKQILGDRDVPHLLQLNKTDHSRAISERDLRRTLGLSPGTRVVSAQALHGDGVRETAVLAIRAAADHVQDRVIKHGFESLDAPPGGPSELTEMMRQEEGRDGRSLVQVVLDARPLASNQDGTAAGGTKSAGPPLPHVYLESGLIWPPNDGRDLLRRATHNTPEALGDENADRVYYEAGMWGLVAQRARTVVTLGAARHHLLTCVRRCLQLGGLLQPHVALCLCNDEAEHYWVWRVAPRVSTLLEGLTYGCRAKNEAFVDERLTAFVSGVRTIRELETKLDVRLHQGLDDFGFVDGQLYYLREDEADASGSLEAVLREPLELELPGSCRDRYRQLVREHLGDTAGNALATAGESSRPSPHQLTASAPDGAFANRGSS